MIRAVLDANVFISGLLSGKGPPGQIVDAWLNHQLRVVISPQIAAEIRRVLNYPRIRKRLESGHADMLIEKLANLCEWSAGDLVLDILSRDPSDNIYLACAIEAKTMYLVTGNLPHYQEAGSHFKELSILTPRQFLAILQADS